MPKQAAKGIEVRFVPDITLEPQRVYSNYAEVNHTPYDFSLRFCDAEPITPAMVAGKEKYEYRVPVVAHIVVPPRLVPIMISALSAQLKSYEAGYGKVGSAPKEEDKTTPR
jgi:hypothetical protein